MVSASFFHGYSEEACKATLVKMLVCVARCQSAGAARLEFEVANDRAGRSQASYGEVFGWHAEPGADYVVTAWKDGRVIEGGIPSAMALDRDLWKVAFYVESMTSRHRSEQSRRQAGPRPQDRPSCLTVADGQPSPIRKKTWADCSPLPNRNWS